MKTKTKTKKLKASSSQSYTNSSSESPDLHIAAVKIAVAQICNSVGYRGAQSSALETLTSVAVTYVKSLAKSAATSANSTGRTESNLYDVIRALDDLHYDVGFHGNSDINRRLCILSDSSILRGIMKFVYSTREIPFAKPLPRHRHELRPIPPCFDNETVEFRHIPMWLPIFPKIAGDGEKLVTPAPTEDETSLEKRFVTTDESIREISKLPEKRKKVSFTIGGSGGKNVIKIDKSMMITILNP